MKQIILNGIYLDELIDRILDALQQRADKTSSKPLQPNQPNLLSRAEVAQLLKISLPTLHEWTKHKLLQSYKIGNRVLYKQDEIENALFHSNNLKYKKSVL